MSGVVEAVLHRVAQQAKNLLDPVLEQVGSQGQPMTLLLRRGAARGEERQRPLVRGCEVVSQVSRGSDEVAVEIRCGPR
jgi:hypothetical protein